MSYDHQLNQPISSETEKMGTVPDLPSEQEQEQPAAPSLIDADLLIFPLSIDPIRTVMSSDVKSGIKKRKSSKLGREFKMKQQQAMKMEKPPTEEGNYYKELELHFKAVDSRDGSGWVCDNPTIEVDPIALIPRHHLPSSSTTGNLRSSFSKRKKFKVIDVRPIEGSSNLGNTEAYIKCDNYPLLNRVPNQASSTESGEVYKSFATLKAVSSMQYFKTETEFAQVQLNLGMGKSFASNFAKSYTVEGTHVIDEKRREYDKYIKTVKDLPKRTPKCGKEWFKVFVRSLEGTNKDDLRDWKSPQFKEDNYANKGGFVYFERSPDFASSHYVNMISMYPVDESQLPTGVEPIKGKVPYGVHENLVKMLDEYFSDRAQKTKIKFSIVIPKVRTSRRAMSTFRFASLLKQPRGLRKDKKAGVVSIKIRIQYNI